MNSYFKKAMADLSLDHTDRYYLRSRGLDYGKIIAFGAFGETGENYYIFIYRNAFEEEGEYGAVVFLYSPLDLEKPLQVTCTDTGIDWKQRNIYITAAVYFLKNQCRNTMALSGTVKFIYDDIKKVIHRQTREQDQKKEKIENFNFDIRDQEIRARQIKLKKPNKDYISFNIRSRLEELKKKEDDKIKGENEKRSKGRLGLSLELPGEYNTARFKPVIIPVRKNGSYGAVKQAGPSQMQKYELDDVPELLKEFTYHLHDQGYGRRHDYTRADTINRVYFERLANLFLNMPDQLTFFQFEPDDREFHQLQKFTFKKIEVKFASKRDRDCLRFWLVLTSDDGRVLEAGTDYQAIVMGKNRVSLFLISTGPQGEQAYFALPGDPQKYDRFFHFLAEVKEFYVHDFPAVRETLQGLESASLVIHPEPLPFYNLKFRPTPVLKILEGDLYENKPERIEVEFDYQPGVDRFLKENPHIRLVDYEIDKNFETMCLQLLGTDPLLKINQGYDFWGQRTRDYSFSFADGGELTWLIERGTTYLDKGFKIYSEKHRQYIGHADRTIRIDISTGIKWLEFKPLLENTSSGETAGIESIDFENRTITDKQGILHLVKKQDIEKLARLAQYAEQYKDIYRIPSENYFLINALYQRRMEDIPQLKEKLSFARKLEDFKKIPQYKLSGKFQGTLRNYQAAGFAWLRFLREYGLAGCLADDMGLGKTVQTLALLRTLKDENQLSTSLLVVPVSAVLNWEMEIERFTPGLTIYRHLGVNREKDFAVWENHDLVITSYATLRNDIEIFKDFHFDYIVLDESQAIKNLAAQVSKAVKILTGRRRLALSGTPIENNSMELWSLFDFLMPGFLGTRQWFKKQWALPVEKYKDSGKAGLLKEMLYPFILRRKKEEVEKELPEKTEIVAPLHMDELQLKVYVETARYYSNEVSRMIEEKGLAKSSFKILEGMLRLRQICLFPRLVDEKYETVPSVKFDHFTEMLEDILSEGHKVLVFSQFVKVLSIIKRHCDRKKINYSYIDGSVDAVNRGKVIKTFQEDDTIGVFLLSLKAGGVAINLTAADYVIIFDPWWNPAMEAQAIDRTHRIGQTKRVMVYRMVVKNTIEEKMLELQEQKKELVEKLITSETKAFKNLTKDDIIKLFQYS